MVLGLTYGRSDTSSWRESKDPGKSESVDSGGEAVDNSVQRESKMWGRRGPQPQDWT